MHALQGGGIHEPAVLIFAAVQLCMQEQHHVAGSSADSAGRRSHVLKMPFHKRAINPAVSGYKVFF